MSRLMTCGWKCRAERLLHQHHTEEESTRTFAVCFGDLVLPDRVNEALSAHSLIETTNGGTRFGDGSTLAARIPEVSQ